MSSSSPITYFSYSEDELVPSPDSHPEVDWRIDDDEVGIMQRKSEEIIAVHDLDFRFGLFLASWADNPHLVKIPLLAGRRAINSHVDLDCNLWLPGAPYDIEYLANTSIGRTKVDVHISSSGLIINYMVIHYDQDSIYDRNSCLNYLVDLFLQGPAYWAKDLLVIKVSPTGNVLNMTLEDVKELHRILN